MNVLIMANYRTPKSGNFAASILDLGLALREQVGEVAFMFPKGTGGGATVGAAGLRGTDFRLFFLMRHCRMKRY